MLYYEHNTRKQPEVPIWMRDVRKYYHHAKVKVLRYGYYCFYCCRSLHSGRENGMSGVSSDVVSEPYLALKKIKEMYFEDYTVYAVNFQDQEYSWGKNAVAYPKPVGGK